VVQLGGNSAKAHAATAPLPDLPDNSGFAGYDRDLTVAISGKAFRA